MKLQECNYELDRTDFDAQSVLDYLLCRSMLCDNFNYSYNDILLYNYTNSEIIGYYDGSEVRNFLEETKIKYDPPSVKSATFFLYSYPEEVLLLTQVELFMLDNIMVDTSKSASSWYFSNSDLEFTYIDYPLFTLNDILRLLILEKDYLINYKLALCDYNIDRTSFDAISVVQFLVLQKNPSDKFKKLLLFYFFEKDFKQLKKHRKSFLKKT
jgi:hypothetical protein